MDWIEHPPSRNPFESVAGIDREYIVTTGTFSGGSSGIPEVISEAVKLAASKLHGNVREDSVYLMFTWDDMNFSLSIYAADSDRNTSYPQVIKCLFDGLTKEIIWSPGKDREFTEMLERLTANIKASIRKALLEVGPMPAGVLKPVFVIFEGDGSLESL